MRNEGGEKGIRKKLNRIVSIYEIEFGFMSEKATIDAVVILRKLQEEHHMKEKSLFYGTRENF